MESRCLEVGLKRGPKLQILNPYTQNPTTSHVFRVMDGSRCLKAAQLPRQIGKVLMAILTLKCNTDMGVPQIRRTIFGLLLFWDMNTRSLPCRT